MCRYRTVILDICQKMGNGMADFTHAAIQSKTATLALLTVEDYDLYCHYVAGLVGEGLSRIFSASKKEAPWLGEQLELSNSMGLLLQKTNIIRDIREDVDIGRLFWPKEIWGSKRFGFNEQREMCICMDSPVKSDLQEKALFALSAMILDAMRHATDSLDYLRVLKNQSVYNFCAIPASMAIATLELCFMNPEVFRRNIKIRKAEAASVITPFSLVERVLTCFVLQLIMRSTNPRESCMIFREYARRIHAKALPNDPSFAGISVACGKVCFLQTFYYAPCLTSSVDRTMV